MKKVFGILLALVLMAGCGSPNQGTAATAEATASAEATTEAASGSTGGINVYTRDASSGTREAFLKAIDLEDIASTAIEVSSNGDMATKVGSDESGIGYVSLTTDFAANNVKPLSFEGVEPTEATVLDGSYTMQRPFSFVTRASDDYESDEKAQLVAAFLDFICNSTEGMQIVEAAGGVVDATQGTPWATLAENHPIVAQDNSAITINTAGSTSVTHTLQAALEAFQPMAGNFQFTMNQTGSGDGWKRVLGEEKDGVNAADIGFASRSFKEEEDTSTAMSTGVYCIDAVVAIVHANNPLTNITAADLKGVYDGSITSFDGIK